ncbi:SCO family protein [Sneathiella chinensis]|uniref:Electron transporter SenC n=1 Tax=Sneathiella chinensis TaxID=349750 RepID=A0ABQ5U8H8_9PROT|nr:SCO family protein [Sneathiella chinensis]GLQ07978.1 electron transporter SenC [Sneathiella chinensis]
MNKVFAYAVALLVIVGLTIAALVFTGVLSGPGQKSRSGIIAGAPQIGGPFELVNHKGETVTDKDFQGKMMLVFFGYTFCPDVCPTEMQTFVQTLDLLGEDADQVTPVFITVDPERDSVDVVREFVAAFHPAIVGLTGTPEQITQVKKQYRAYGQKANSEDKEYYLVDHTSFTYLMGRDGSLSTVFSYGTTAEEMAKVIREQL